MYKTELSVKNQPLFLQQKYLSHKNIGTQWWDFHADLFTLKDNQKFSISATLFQKSLGNIQLYHTHSYFLDIKSQKYYYRSKGDRRLPKMMANHLKSCHHNDYIQRAFQEVLQKGEYPLPDKKSAHTPQINWKSMNFVMDDMTIYQDEQNNYHVEVNFEEYYGFNLQFVPMKQVILSSKDDAIHDLQIFNSSVPRMEVTGTVKIGQEVHQVEGSGWYERKLLATQKNSIFKDNQSQWTWIAIQLENNGEIVYNPALIDFENNQINSEANIIYISPEGKISYHCGNLEKIDTWTSLHTFIEYGVAWFLSIEELNLKLHLKAEIPNQEIISIIAQPAYWKGRIQVEGTYKNNYIKGIGFVEQVGNGSKHSNYKNYLRAVSKKALSAVERCYPLEPTYEDLRRLIVDQGFDLFLEGISQESFVKNLIQPVRTITDRGGKAWRSMSLFLCITAVGGDPQAFEDFLAFPELIHTGSLIVDDVQDYSSMRRGVNIGLLS